MAEINYDSAIFYYENTITIILFFIFKFKFSAPWIDANLPSNKY
jgi:hypothetical protein